MRARACCPARQHGAGPRQPRAGSPRRLPSVSNAVRPTAGLGPQNLTVPDEWRMPASGSLPSGALPVTAIVPLACV
jgi:hypothetical protein